jgi:hypothetical protein
VGIFTYPLVLTLRGIHHSQPNSLGFTLSGPPGPYIIFASTDLREWNQIGMVTNFSGIIPFTDLGAAASSLKFYRARSAP